MYHTYELTDFFRGKKKDFQRTKLDLNLLMHISVSEDIIIISKELHLNNKTCQIGRAHV